MSKKNNHNSFGFFKTKDEAEDTFYQEILDEILIKKPATIRQKKLIHYINKKLKIDEELNAEILQSIKTFEEADQYIKKYLPIVKFRELRGFEILNVYCYLIEKTDELCKIFC